MVLDIPRVEYKTSKANSTTSNPHKLSPNDPSIKLQEEANRKAHERRKQNEWRRMKLSDLNTHTNTEHNG